MNTNPILRFVIPLSVVLGGMLMSSLANAAVVFDLTTGGLAGADLDASNGDYTDPTTGVNIDVSTTTTLPGNTGSVFNAVSGGGGVDSLSVTSTGNDAGSQVDAEEVLTFTFTFTQPTIELVSIDLAGQDGNATGGDQVFVNVDGVTTTLFAGAADYSGTTDLWTPSAPITLSSGDTIVFTGEDTFRVTDINFDVVAVPEPSSLAILGITGFACSCIRRRKRQA